MTGKVRALPALWRLQQRDYPATDVGRYAAAAVRCCADDLEAALAVSGTLTDERIRETDGDWQREAILRGRTR